MKHLEKDQQPVPQKKKSKSTISQGSGWKTTIAGLLLIAGLGYGMTSFWNNSQMDNVSDFQKTELVTAFSKLDKISVELIQESEIDGAIESMHLAPDQRELLKQHLIDNKLDFSNGKINVNPISSTDSSKPKVISNNETALVWVNLWDFATVDGDVVTVSSAGYNVTVPLHGSPSRIAVPLDNTGTITIIGDRDGGGGVTLGVQSGASAISLPVLAVGQTLLLPVAF